MLVLVLGLLGGGAYVFWDRMSSALGGLDLSFGFNSASEDYSGPGVDPVQVVIPAGATGTMMGTVLAEADVVASVGAFTQAFESSPAAASIQPGTYELYTQMSAAEAIESLLTNEKIETRVTIPEGYVVEQVIDRIASVTEFSREDVEEALADPESIGLPKSAGGNAEGWLFPKTYSVQPDDTVVDLLSTMVGQTKAELNAAGVDNADRQDVLIKASLVEREAKHDEDRPKMARAIENRLATDMALQIDATTAYGIEKSGTELTHADNNDASNEYSTYAHAGLPPGPIANPGAASIEAVVNPADGPWKFWCTVNLDTGETKFEESHEAHLVNQAELRAWQRENGHR
ncbi:endolytic transglycosylase MltG [Isoptericola halotolerans]